MYNGSQPVGLVVGKVVVERSVFAEGERFDPDAEIGDVRKANRLSSARKKRYDGVATE